MLIVDLLSVATKNLFEFFGSNFIIKFVKLLVISIGDGGGDGGGGGAVVVIISSSSYR